MSTDKIIILLPMKAHSERIPNKNFRIFNGKPLYRWMLDILLEMDAFKIIINTDANEIISNLELRSNSRLILKERKESLCGDFVSMNKIIEDDISEYSADIYLMTHTTNPLISKNTVERALREYRYGILSGHDSLFTVNKYQSRFFRSDGSPLNHDKNNLLRTQDLEPLYEENSCIYIFNRESFSNTKSRIGLKPVLFLTPKIESIDIDDMDSWALAESISKSKSLL
jgi:CMP-N-acetylneuraminic acid synthetase